MPTTAYLDIIGGISGDMILAAIIDIGLPKRRLEAELAKVAGDQFRLITQKTQRGSIKATHLKVQPNQSDQHTHRWNWDDFSRAYRNSSLPHEDKHKIDAIFECLQLAEIDAHADDDDPDSAHLHELGTIDTLIDIAGAVIGMRLLGVQRIYASPIPASHGTASSSHGISASFAPATMSIIRNADIPIRVSSHRQDINHPQGESVTPTGAAILATLATFRSAAEMTISKNAYGAGTRDSHHPPNVLGLWIGESHQPTPTQPRPALAHSYAAEIGVRDQADTTLIETNIDDMTGEEIAHAVELINSTGALDTWITPIQMKKGRPAVLLSVLTPDRHAQSIASVIFAHTTTLGIRIRPIERLIADRETISVSTQFGPIRVKLKKINGKTVQLAPEYEDCALIARQTGIPIRKITQTAAAEAEKATQTPSSQTRHAQ